MRQVFIAAVLLLIGAGCLPVEPRLPAVSDLPVTPPEAAPPAAPEPAASAPESTGVSAQVIGPPETAVSVQVTAPEPPAPAPAPRSYYLAYTKAQYEKALADGRPVLLYFYATWCPICRADEPKLKSQLDSTGVPVAGFRVNYNDPDTDADEKALAKALGVTYQHTTIIFDRSGRESDRFTGPVAAATLEAALVEANR